MPGTADTGNVTASCSNAGPNNATGANVAVTLPAALSGVSYQVLQTGGASGATAGSGNINQTVNVPVGGIIYYYVRGTISSAATGTLSTTATVTAPAGTIDVNTANNTATDSDALGQPVDLQIANTDYLASAVPGTADTYVIIVSNAGPNNATGANVVVTLPAALSGVSYQVLQNRRQRGAPRRRREHQPNSQCPGRWHHLLLRACHDQFRRYWHVEHNRHRDRAGRHDRPQRRQQHGHRHRHAQPAR